MSTQSILLKDKAHYAKEFEKQILWNADRYYMHRFYKLGEDMNFNEAMYYSKMGSFICTKNCELIDWIKNKLEGKTVGLFGSNDWGTGEFLETWKEELEGLGAKVVGDGLVINLAPDDDDKIEASKNYGKTIVG